MQKKTDKLFSSGARETVMGTDRQYKADAKEREFRRLGGDSRDLVTGCLGPTTKSATRKKDKDKTGPGQTRARSCSDRKREDGEKLGQRGDAGMGERERVTWG